MSEQAAARALFVMTGLVPGGNPKGATAHAYRSITGNWPPRSFDYETAPTAHVSDALARKLKSQIIAYAKRNR